jgi:hypothetical protein
MCKVFVPMLDLTKLTGYNPNNDFYVEDEDP